MMVKSFRRMLSALGLHVSKTSPANSSLNEIRLLLAGIDEPLIFDVGARHGQTAAMYSSAIRKARLHCFGPFPESYRCLQENRRRYPRAKLLNCGFSDKAGWQTLYSNQGSPTNSLLPNHPDAESTWGNEGLRPIGTHECDFTTVDNYCHEMSITNINLLKMDVQGAESRVLKGAQRMLRDGRISNIYMEIILAPTYLGQSNLTEYLEIMSGFGYRIHGFYNLEHGAKRDLLQLDSLFTKGS